MVGGEESRLNSLLAEFPEPEGDPEDLEQKLLLLKWLKELFKLWGNEATNKEVEGRRNEIAYKVGVAYRLQPDNNVSLRPPNIHRRDPEFVAWISTMAINTLIESDVNRRNIVIYFAPSWVDDCLGS